jgi:hypothetical protein
MQGISVVGAMRLEKGSMVDWKTGVRDLWGFSMLRDAATRLLSIRG